MNFKYESVRGGGKQKIEDRGVHVFDLPKRNNEYQSTCWQLHQCRQPDLAKKNKNQPLRTSDKSVWQSPVTGSNIFYCSLLFFLHFPSLILNKLQGLVKIVCPPSICKSNFPLLSFPENRGNFDCFFGIFQQLYCDFWRQYVSLKLNKNKRLHAQDGSGIFTERKRKIHRTGA